MRKQLSDEERRAGRLAAVKRWKQKNPEKVKAYKRADHARMSKERRARMNAAHLANARTQRQAVLDLLGGQCCRCGFTDSRALHVDHVNGGGSQERRILRSAHMRYKKILIDPSGYQLLCANCNFIKKAEEQEHRWRTGED